MFMNDITALIREYQRIFHDSIVDYLQQIASVDTVLPVLSLSVAGFVYGVLHAAGPGHGKVIVSSYMMANEQDLPRGLTIIALSSLMQACVAILLVLSFFYILNLARAQAEHLTRMLELLSYVLVGMLGVSMCVRGIHGMIRQHPHTHHHHHHHQGECCGHAPIPTSQKVIRGHSFYDMLMMIVSIGMRPCTGAVMLLFLACMWNVTWAGICAVLVMACGTALTTGVLAFLAVRSRQWMMRYVEASEHRMINLDHWLKVIGGSIIMVVAIVFFTTAYDSKMETRPNAAIIGLPR